MIVHFVVPTSGVEKNIDMYRAVIQAIHEHGDVLARDWILPAYFRKMPKSAELDNVRITQQILEATDRADVLIVDASSGYSFGTGYQTAIALEKKKPVLILQREKEVGGIMVLGLRNSLLTYKTVNDKNLANTVTTFLKANTIDTKELRFNFVIDRSIYKHLRKQSRLTGKTKAEIIRQLLEEDIERTQ